MSIDSCIREAREEIGVELKAENMKLIEVKETPYFFKDIHGIHFIYATTIDENEKIVINDESEEYKWFDLDKLPDRTIDSKEEINKFASLAKKHFKCL
jgi:8-oxo-dGTP pyrophosphatase MutT (NUDIX family)